jgi:O-antigen/teichoic acid export membrane protein
MPTIPPGDERIVPTLSSAAHRGASNLSKMLGGRLGAQLILALSVFVIARRMGAETYGLYAGILAVVSILQAASAGGLHMVEVRTLAPLWRRGERQAARTLASTIWGSRIILSACTALLAVLWLNGSNKLSQSVGIGLLVGLFCFLRNSYEAARSLLLPVGHAGTLILFELLRAGLTLPLVLTAFALGGLDGVFVAFALFYLLMLLACTRVLHGILPISFRAFHWPSLQPHLGYSFSSFLGTVATMVQAQFAVFALANWVTGSAAAFLGLAVQFFALGQGIVLTGQRALLPILAELEAAGEKARLAIWGERMLRYSAASASLLVVGWSFAGREIAPWLLGNEFAPVYPCVVWILLAALFYALAEGCNGLLYIRGLAATASACTFLFSATTILGLLLILRRASDSIALDVCRLYALAACLFFIASFISLGTCGKLWLPLGRVLALLVPILLIWPALAGSFPTAFRWVLALAWAPLYLGTASFFRLLPLAEGKELLRILRQPSTAAQQGEAN